MKISPRRSTHLSLSKKRLLLHVRVGAKNRLGKPFRLIAQSVDVRAYFVVTDDNTHTAAHMSNGLSEDANPGMVLRANILEVVIERLIALDGRQDDSRSTVMLKMDGRNRQSHDGTEMELKLAEISAVRERHHSGVVWTRTQFGEDNLTHSTPQMPYPVRALVTFSAISSAVLNCSSPMA